MTNALTQRAYQTPLSRDRITARCRAFGPPTELPELNCWSIEKHAGHLASCNSLRMSVANPLWGASTANCSSLSFRYTHGRAAYDIIEECVEAWLAKRRKKK
jgi:hypothetical protein